MKKYLSTSYWTNLLQKQSKSSNDEEHIESIETSVEETPQISSKDAADRLGLREPHVIAAKRIAKTSPYEYSLRTLGISDEELQEFKAYKKMSRGEKIRSLIGDAPLTMAEFTSLSYNAFLEFKREDRNAFKYLPIKERLRRLEGVIMEVRKVPAGNKKQLANLMLKIPMYCYMVIQGLVAGVKVYKKPVPANDIEFEVENTLESKQLSHEEI